MADIPPFSSPGLMGLPHFRSSRVSRELWEPVYLNLFTVNIQLPEALKTQLGSAATEDQNLLLEGVKKVGGLDTQKVPDVVEQTYKWATRSFAGSGAKDTTVDLTLDFEINVRGCAEGTPNMYTLRILRMWNDLIWDPLTGTQGLKVEYVAPQMEIVLHDKKGNPFWMWRCYHVFPKTNLNAPEFDFSKKTDLYKVTNYTLRCDYWDEAML